MKNAYAQILKPLMGADSFEKLAALENEKLHAFVADAAEVCKPDSLLVCSDDAEDIAAIRQRTIDIGEERPLATEGHTVHFDGYYDQARDKAATKYLVPPTMELGGNLNQTERESGLEEVRGFLAGAMSGKQAYVRFFCLGPTESPFSLACAQITDSAYVAHSEDLLYRTGYEQFRRLGGSGKFFRFLHSAGRLDENNTSADVEKRRVYIDIAEDMVYSSNTQYGGNTIGLKKLALRLAIRKADTEGWLAEHMFLMGVHGPKDRTTFFAGAFPSACGKTSTAMLPGETIVGDDLAYLRNIDGATRSVNVESGIFGIIRDVNPDDDPEIYKVLTRPGEVIFSNVLVKDDKPYWLGMGSELPMDGWNHSGKWHDGKIDRDGNEIPPSHKNARYTVAIERLANCDENLHAPEGVELGGVIYGGRDSDTWVPVKQSFNWNHGIVTMGASLESETTSATLGEEGVRSFNLMSIMDFVSIPLGKYIRNNLEFGRQVSEPPLIFGTNYFLRDEHGDFLNGKMDKAVWVKWMELRVHGDVEVIEGPTGLLPRYEDLAELFRAVRGKDYSRDDYVRQFTVRVPENLAKIERVERIYREDVADTPREVFDELAAQRDRLEAFRKEKGDYVSPLDL